MERSPMKHEPMTEAELAELERVYMAATEGPCDARYMQDAIPVACVHFGVVSLSQGVETGRMWQRDDAEMYAALHNAFPRLLATIREAREALAKVAEGEMVDAAATGAWTDIAYNQACRDIAAKIRRGKC
jgi:hypothetical protein